MLVTRLCGGIGNQMFQYAIGRAYALTLNVELKLDISSFDADHLRSYSLGLWKGITAPVTYKPVGTTIQEVGMPYNIGIDNKVTDNCTLKGFWQTEKYFYQIASLLRSEFLPKLPLPTRSKITERQIQKEDNKSAFLTIRRTDYTQSNYHGVLPLNYYLDACQIIASQVTDPHFFIFSDEPDWVKNNFKIPYRMTVAGNYYQTDGTTLGREDAELWLMTRCRHAVMANSSYSWWGAWLGSDRDKIVIGPKNWFLNAPENPRDIIPDRWIKI